MKPQPPIRQLNWEEQSLSTLSTLTDKGALMKMNNPRAARSRYRGHATRLSPRRSRTLTPRRQQNRTPRRSLSPGNEVPLGEPPKRGGLFRSKAASPTRSRHTSGRQSPDQLSKKSKRTVTTLKRTQKTRSELPRSSRREIPMEESRYYRSFSPKRAVPPSYHMEPQVAMKYSYEPDKLAPPPLKRKTSSYRTEYYNDRFQDNFDVDPLAFRPAGDYKVDLARVRSLNTPAQTNVLRPPELDEEDEDNISEASSSIFADLDKEEDSTIWGDLEDNGRSKSGRQHQRMLRRRRRVTTSMDESEQYGEIRLSPRTIYRRRPVLDDIESTGGGITTVGDQNFFGSEPFGQDTFSVCIFFQDLLTRDCPSFFRW